MYVCTHVAIQAGLFRRGQPNHRFITPRLELTRIVTVAPCQSCQRTYTYVRLLRVTGVTAIHIACVNHASCGEGGRTGSAHSFVLILHSKSIGCDLAPKETNRRNILFLLDFSPTTRMNEACNANRVQSVTIQNLSRNCRHVGAESPALFLKMISAAVSPTPGACFVSTDSRWNAVIYTRWK